MNTTVLCEGVIGLSRMIADVVRVRSNFTRSVNIERDHGEWLSDQGHYILTPLARRLTGQVIEAMLSPQGSRAWTITGPYGTGKSAFALALVQLLSAQGPSSSLYKEAIRQDSELATALVKLQERGHPLRAVLISGRRDALVPALHEGLHSAVAGALQDTQSVEAWSLLEKIRVTDREDAVKVCALYQEAANLWNGMIVVVDELGKFLEYVAQRPDRGDIFALQLLAEAAARSGSRPLLLFTVLHQAVARYSGHLTQAQREEFGKVQGRFQDIPFHQSHDQMVRLVGAALEISGTAKERTLLMRTSLRVIKKATALGVGLGNSNSFADDLASCAPIHPLTALLLGPLFRHLAQNERSLFAFLASSEPAGLQEFMREHSLDQNGVALYTPDRLYDYVTASLGTALYQERVGRRWALVQATLDRLRNVDALDVKIIKTVGLIAAIGETNELRATPQVIALALDMSLEAAKAALERLARKSALVYRSFVEAYHLWDGSDIDIESRLAEARGYVDEAQSLDELLTDLLPPRPIVARRYSFSTGTLRFFEATYISAANVGKVLLSGPRDGDGLVVFVLVESAGQLEQVRTVAYKPEVEQSARTIVIPIHIPTALRGAALELRRLKWVVDNTPELSGDAVALAELRSRVHETEQLLRRQVEYAVSAADVSLECIYQGTTRIVNGWRMLNQLVTEACYCIYPLTPAITNELINRHSLSSAATAARRILLDRMLHHHASANLGIDRHPPELSMYLSLLKTTGLHQEGPGGWKFAAPSEGTSLAPIWVAWETFLHDSRTERKPLRLLWELLAAPPYGIRNGIIPVLILAMLLERSVEVGVYETGTFIPNLTLPHVERFLKAPEKFEVRFCPLNGVRRDVFDELATIGLPTATGHLIPVVKQLCSMAARLPDYSKKTKSVSPEAQRVRLALLTAREPDVLIFRQLPEAVGLASMLYDHPNANPRWFAQKLGGVLQELQMAHTRLHDHLFHLIATTLELPAHDPAAARRDLKARCLMVKDMAIDLRMKSFLRHCSNDQQDFSTWVESMGSFLASRPPSTWADDDLSKFESELGQIARKFKNLMELAVATGRTSVEAGVDAVRLGLTGTDGSEREKVIFVRPEQRVTAVAAVDEITRLLQEHGASSEERLAVLALLAQAWLPKPEDTLD